ncbi:PREDICTED: glucosidase 2 subunit beta-like isoform X2 [Nelumbo nucifera]|uniref:Glucosidase 2 subunit beta n=2 Tax=Nelumbo nucifera TaxID=4432 RepID=A0A822YES1_NELNU|nr:PREDICTED: glucosidase 2 subunit beta-like isoform X2 [Nelumbo nucifera]DAD32664.1 TPA_asm: hypothetical protein HUJ06_011515 [Nelumbo nucifera]
MMGTCRFSLLLGIFFLLSIPRSGSAASKDSLGIAPEDEKYFKGEIIKCKDGSKKFTKAQMNDDFCDCPDGTDEPGTSACPGGKFYCQNAGYVPSSLFSSRVNDGICDCCDGSDEYDGKAKCPNTCWEAGKVARDKLNKKIATYKEGVIIRKQEVEQAKQAIAKDEAELSKLKNEEKILKDLVQQLKGRKEQIEKAEEQERLEKEKEEKRKKEAEKKADEEKNQATETSYDDVIGLLEDPSDETKVFEAEKKAEEEKNQATETSYDDIIGLVEDPPDKTKVFEAEKKSNEEKNQATETLYDDIIGLVEDPPDKTEVNEVSDNTEGLSKEELGRRVASRWTGENTASKTKEYNAAEGEGHKIAEEAPESKRDEVYGHYASENDEDDPIYDDEDIEDGDINDELNEEYHDDSSTSYKPKSEDQTDFSDIKTSRPSWLEKMQQKVFKLLQKLNLFQTPVDKSEAARIRKEYDDSNSKLTKVQSRISTLTEKLKHDFGQHKEFYSFYDHCFENKQNKYVYKICPFKKASQVEGHSTTQLGHWEKFEDSYKVMIFSHGDRCWNGPDRSLKVKLRCGLKNELADVDEPSRCEYVAVLSTPALCLEEKLKELQDKLDLMNRGQPQSHDEL